MISVNMSIIAFKSVTEFLSHYIIDTARSSTDRATISEHKHFSTTSLSI